MTLRRVQIHSLARLKNAYDSVQWKTVSLLSRAGHVIVTYSLSDMDIAVCQLKQTVYAMIA
jgi:hypothetical protein